jgi:hypothetical protein
MGSIPTVGSLQGCIPAGSCLHPLLGITGPAPLPLFLHNNTVWVRYSVPCSAGTHVNRHAASSHRVPNLLSYVILPDAVLHCDTKFIPAVNEVRMRGVLLSASQWQKLEQSRSLADAGVRIN